MESSPKAQTCIGSTVRNRRFARTLTVVADLLQDVRNVPGFVATFSGGRGDHLSGDMAHFAACTAAFADKTGAIITERRVEIDDR